MREAGSLPSAGGVASLAAVAVGVLVDNFGKLYAAWRDGHDGEFDKQDWGGSDIELAENAQASLTRVCVKAGGNVTIKASSPITITENVIVDSEDNDGDITIIANETVDDVDGSNELLEPQEEEDLIPLVLDLA